MFAALAASAAASIASAAAGPVAGWLPDGDVGVAEPPELLDVDANAALADRTP